MLKMRAPEGVTAFSHQGYPVVIEDGQVLIEERHRSEFEAHGFRPAAEAATGPDRPLDLRKQALLGLFSDRLDGMTDEEIDAMLADARATQQREEDQAAAIDPAAMTPSAVDAMTRSALFAFLKARGVPAVPPITNEALRERAQAALAA